MDEKLTMREIGDTCNVNHKTIYYYLKKFGITANNRTGARKERLQISLPTYLLDSIKGFSREAEQSLSSLIKNVLIEHMLENHYNPFSNRKFKDKNV